MAWSRAEFENAAMAFRHRWRDAIKLLQISPRRFCDLVQFMDAEFQLPEHARDGIRTDDPHYAITKQMHLRFMAYPATEELQSPYELLLQIIENGGCYSVEHRYIDVRDDKHEPVGGFDLTTT